MADVGVVQRGQDFGFALEAGQAVRIGGEHLREDFERNVSVELEQIPISDDRQK